MECGVRNSNPVKEATRGDHVTGVDVNIPSLVTVVGVTPTPTGELG